MSVRRRILPALFSLLLLLAPIVASAGLGASMLRGAQRGAARGAERGAIKGAERGASRAAGRSVAKSVAPSRLVKRLATAKVWSPPTKADLKADALAHKRFPEVKTSKPVTVHRYVGEPEAKALRKPGFTFKKGTHFAPAGAGRPMSAEHAQQQFNLPVLPNKRLTTTLPSGTVIRMGAVSGGAPRKVELVNESRVPGNAKRISTLPHTPTPPASH